ncbi:hypothetical protein [Streptomyces decoyicus]
MAVAEAVARRTWQTLADALDNPDDVRGFRRREAQRDQLPVCQKCDGPLESSRFEADPLEDTAPRADGAHCAGCCIQLAGPTSRFGRVIRRLVNGDE